MRGHGGRGFRADIEGLRAVAVVAVVLFHAGVPGTSGGYVGVDVFFVLSGFLITGLLWREVGERGRVDLARFYARRVRRLLPAAALVVAGTVGLSALFLSPLRAADVARDGLASALYAANYRFASAATDYFAATEPSPLLHFWSLAVEEQFYVVWPLLLVAARRRAAYALGAVVVVSFVACVWLTGDAKQWAFFSLPTRAWELGAGGLVALAAPRLRTLRPAVATVLGWAGLAAILLAVVTYDDRTAFPGPAAALPVLGTVAVVVAGCASTRRGVASLLGRAVPRAIGRVSYSWYLWHFPVLILAAPSSWVVGAPLAVATVVPAALTLRFVENPVRFSRTLSTRRSLALGVALTGVATAAALGTGVALPEPEGDVTAAAAPALTAAPTTGATAAPTLADVVARQVEAATRTASVPKNLEPSLTRARSDKPRHVNDGCHLSYERTRPGRCTYGTGADAILLTGDSHAGQWFPAIEGVAKSKGWRLLAMTKSTCPPFALDVFSPVLGRAYRECAAFRAEVLARVRAERPKVVVLGAARHYEERLYGFAPYGAEWLAAMAATVKEVEATGARVVVLGPTPRTRGNVPDCLAGHLDRAGSCMRDVASAFDRSGIDAERAAVTEAGGAYLDVQPLLCGRNACPVVVGTMLVYRDDNHLTTVYPAWLAPAVGEGIDAALHP
ncbi:MAG TPA: acyltransferase family protein [Frankiaceae bacterium]|nr:acyltransferase family protein [Frankiaceae bacterium]